VSKKKSDVPVNGFIASTVVVAAAGKIAKVLEIKTTVISNASILACFMNFSPFSLFSPFSNRINVDLPFKDYGIIFYFLNQQKER